MNGAAWLLESRPGRDDAHIALVCRAGGAGTDADAVAGAEAGAGALDHLSYGELRERVARAGAAWRARGLAPGEPVAVKLPDGIEWVVAWLGVLWAGGVAVGVNPRVPAAEWQAMLDEARFAFVVVESLGQDAGTSTSTNMGASTSHGPGTRTGMGATAGAAADEVRPASPPRLVTLAEARAAWRAATPCAAVARDDEAPAFWVHSSGSSGRPKAVVHAQRTLRSIAMVSTQRLGIVPADRLFGSSRLFFTYPLVNVLLAGLATGCTVLLDPAWPNAAALAAAVRRLSPTVLFSVPSLYRDLMREGHAAALREAGLRLCVSAGEPLPARLGRRWREASGLPIVNGYGTSETLVLVLTSAAPALAAGKARVGEPDAPDEPCEPGAPGALGKGAGHEGDQDGREREEADEGQEDALAPSPGVEVRPLDAAAAAAGEPTRLELRTPTLALGYHDRPAAAAASFTAEGAFCPADLFVPAGAGCWRFAGREDSLVKLRGRWVDLVALEQQLSSEVGELREAAAARVADADGLEAVALFFVADDPARAQARLAERVAMLPPHQRPASLHALPALPRTGTGKLLRRELAARAAAELAASAACAACAPCAPFTPAATFAAPAPGTPCEPCAPCEACASDASGAARTQWATAASTRTP
ncbi:MAG: AMP-binding protein [Burkholderiales bacterium]|nr:AMP-binding protein [Burkholderiales bacterium]